MSSQVNRQRHEKAFDRLTHHCHVFSITCDSFHLRVKIFIY